MWARALSHVSLWLAMIVSCACTSSARAEPELQLAWPALTGCPERDSIVQRVETQLARKLGERRTTLRASATIARNEAGYRLTLRTEREGEQGTERGERVFAAASCAEVSGAAALLIALTMEAPEAATQERAPETELSPHEAPAPVYALRAGAVGERGSLPRIAAGAEIGVAIALRHSHAELAALWLPPVYSERNPEGARVEVTMWTARAGYCHDLLGRALLLLGCAGAEFGRVSGRGSSLRSAAERHFVWGAGLLSARLVSELTPPLSLYLEPQVAVPVARRRFVSRGAQGEPSALHTPSALSLRLQFGAQLAF